MQALSDIHLPIRKFASPEVVFGSGSIDLVGQQASNLSRWQVLVVSDEGVRDAGWTRMVEKSLERSGLEYIIFDRVSVNPRIDDVMEGTQRYLDEGCDVIIAVGGGSPMDCAKCIGIMASNGGDLRDLEGVDRISIPGPPLICVPTTAGSSADVSPFAVITDAEKRRKMVLISKLLIPDLSVIDPDTSMTMDAEVTISSGIDALSHAFESYVSNISSPTTDLFAREAVRIIARDLPAVHSDPGDISARERMMLGALYAGLSFSNASVGLLHAMSHAVGGLYDSGHGMVTCALLEHVIDYNSPFAGDRYDELGRIMFGKSGSLTTGLKDLFEELGARRSLGDLGVKREDIPFLSDCAIQDPCLATNPRPAGPGEVEVLYERAL